MSFGKTTFQWWRGSLLTIAVFGLSVLLSASVRAQFTQNFDVVPAPGWTTQNNSTPVGTTGWFQGNSTVFPSQAGAGNSYIGANFNSTTGTNTISNWLISPQTNLANGNQLKFWTRTTTANPFPDRLQVRLSTAGASTNVGSGPTGTGDFSEVLIDINPDYNTGGGSPPIYYPEVWTEVTLTLAAIPGGASGRFAFRYFVELGGPTGDNSNYIGIDTVSFTASSPPVGNGPLDYDGDGRTDFVVVRNTGGGSGGQITWFINNGTSTSGIAWGISTDFFVSGDFDGDGKDDVTVYRPSSPGQSNFYILQSQTSTVKLENLGQTGDDPTIVGDYDGDGKADAAVYRGGASAGQPSYWYYRGSLSNPGGNITYIQWGQNGDFPAPGNYDGDLKNDFVVQRNTGTGQGRFWMQQSTAGFNASIVYGTSSDLILPGDYDGDGKTDICVARGGGGQIIWYYRRSSDGVSVGPITFGVSATDFPTQGDYNGDGRTDIAIWRPNASVTQNYFWVRDTVGGGITVSEWGQQGDYPVANYNSH